MCDGILDFALIYNFISTTEFFRIGSLSTMTDNTPKPINIGTGKLGPVIVDVNSSVPAGNSVTPVNVIAVVDSTSHAGDAGRKKSGFLITRVDKASTPATILENESDFENEFNDHGCNHVNSPGSSSIMSDGSTVDGGSLEKPLKIARAPPSTPAAATPTNPTWPAATIQQRPGGLTALVTANNAMAGAAALLSAAANLGQQPNSAPHLQQTVVIGTPSPSSAPPAPLNRESSSRFHIIKIETGPYKRGRWNCRDFDESASGSGSSATRSDMIAVGPRSGSSSNSSGRPSFHLVAEENGHGDHALLLLTTASDHSASHQQTSHHTGGLASKPPLPTGHHHQHHPTHHHNYHPPQLHSPLPTSLQQGLSKTTAQHADVTGTSKGVAATSKQASTISQSAAASASTSAPLSNVAQQRSQSPVVTAPAAANMTATVLATPATPASATSTTVSRFQVRPAAVDLNNAAAAILDSIVGSMQNDNNRIVIGAGGRQQESVVASSTGSTTATGATAVASVVDGSIGAGTGGVGQGAALAPGSAGANVVAIDNKIEQAMDLVKTHLLYAVREEVEVLKEKIIDLEKKVFRLETENKLLREYAPPEILQQIQHQHHQQPSSSASISNAANQTNSIPSSVPTTTTQQQQSIPSAQSQQSQASTQAAPLVTTQQSVQGSATANISVPTTTTSATLPPASVHQQQQQ